MDPEFADRGVTHLLPFHIQARTELFKYMKSVDFYHLDRHPTFSVDEILVVWAAKVLKNWKCILITTLPDKTIFEVTFNGDTKEIYIDAYQKFDNVLIKED